LAIRGKEGGTSVVLVEGETIFGNDTSGGGNAGLTLANLSPG